MGQLLDQRLTTGGGYGPLFARRKGLGLRESLRAVHLGQGADGATAAGVLGLPCHGLLALGHAPFATLAGGFDPQPRKLGLCGSREGVAVGLARSQHPLLRWWPASAPRRPPLRLRFFFLAKRRKKWPKGPGCRSRCWAASMSIQRA